MWSVNPFTSISLALMLRCQLNFLSRLIWFRKTTTFGGVTNRHSKSTHTVFGLAGVLTGEKVEVPRGKNEDVGNTTIERGVVPTPY